MSLRFVTCSIYLCVPQGCEERSNVFYLNTIPRAHEYQLLDNTNLFVLMLYIPINNFLSCWDDDLSSWDGIKSLAQGHNTVTLPASLKLATLRSPVYSILDGMTGMVAIGMDSLGQYQHLRLILVYLV